MQLTFRYASSTPIIAPSSSSVSRDNQDSLLRKSVEAAAAITAMKMRYSLGASGFFDDHIFERRGKITTIGLLLFHRSLSHIFCMYLDIFDLVANQSPVRSKRIKDSDYFLQQLQQKHKYPSFVKPLLPIGQWQVWNQYEDECMVLHKFAEEIQKNMQNRYLQNTSRYFSYLPKLESHFTSRKDLIADQTTRNYFLETGWTVQRVDQFTQYYPLLCPAPTPLLLVDYADREDAVDKSKLVEDLFVSHILRWQMYLAQQLQKESMHISDQAKDNSVGLIANHSDKSRSTSLFSTAAVVQKLPSLSQLKDSFSNYKGGSAKYNFKRLPSLKTRSAYFFNIREEPHQYSPVGNIRSKQKPLSSQGHLLPVHHDSIRSLLALPYDVHCLELVRRLDDYFRQSNLQDDSPSSNPPSNIRLQATHAKLRLPPFDLTYQLYYSILHYARDLPLLLHLSVLDHMNGNITLYYLLDKWRRLFDIQELVQTLEALHEEWHRHALRSPNTVANLHYHSKQKFDYSTGSLSLLPSSERGMPIDHSITKEGENRYIVYFRGDPSLTQDITIYIQLIQDCLTLYALLQVMMTCPMLINAVQFHPQHSQSTDSHQNSSCMARKYSFLHLPYRLVLDAEITQAIGSMPRPVHGIPLVTDEALSKQLEAMSSMLHVDMVLVILLPMMSQYSKSIRCLELQALKKMRLLQNPTFQSKEERLLHLVNDSEVDTDIFLQRYDELFLNTGNMDGGNYLYLSYFLAKFLPSMLCSEDSASSTTSNPTFLLGTDLVVNALFPMIGPQYLRSSFFPEIPLTLPLLQALRCRPSLGNDRTSSVHVREMEESEQKALRIRCEKYSQVLTRWMRQHYSTRSDDNCREVGYNDADSNQKSMMLIAVEDWLELHLFLHYTSSSVATHSSHLVAARSILRKYTNQVGPMLKISLDICLRYAFYEGALLLLDSIATNDGGQLSWQLWELVHILAMRLFELLLQHHVQFFEQNGASTSEHDISSAEMDTIQIFMKSLYRLCKCFHDEQQEDKDMVLDFCLYRPIATMFSSLAIDSLARLHAYEALAKFVVKHLLPFFANKALLALFIKEAHCFEIIRSHQLLSIDFYLTELVD